MNALLLSVPRAEVAQQAAYALSLQQQRFWLLDQLMPANPAYNIAVRWRLSGPFDANLLEQAINRIVARHDVLRTRFEMMGKTPRQIVEPLLRVPLKVIDLRAHPTPEQEVERLTSIEAQEPFTLTELPLIRASLLCIKERESMLLVTTHHIISDGWSVGVFVDELARFYEALSGGREPDLADLPFQYQDYAEWQREELTGGALDGQIDYWKRKLSNLPAFELKTDRPRPSVQTSNGAISSILLPRELTDALVAFSAQHGVTFYMTALAALSSLLNRYSGLSDVVMGTPVAGRASVDSESLIGAFINILVLRIDASGDPKFDELLGRTRDVVLEALERQDTPFERLVEALKPKRDLSRTPLFQINFIYQRAFVRNQSFAGITLTDVPSRSAGSLYDLNFFMVERVEGWRASCEYNTDLFDDSTVALMLQRFRATLEAVLVNPKVRISQLRWQTESAQTAPPAALSQESVSQAVRADSHGSELPSESFESKLLPIWGEVLERDGLGLDDDFFEFGGNSILAAAMMARISEQTGIKISLANVFNMPTVRQLAKVMRNGGLSQVSHRLVRLQPLGSRPPFFMVEAQSRFRFLAHRLGTEQPLFSLVVPGEVEGQMPYDLERIARYHLETILETQATGPYYLGGYSAGGIMAYEIAQRLIEREKKVALLVLFDTANPYFMHEYSRVEAFRARQKKRFEYHFGNLRNMRLTEFPRYVLGKAASASSRTRARFASMPGSKVGQQVELDQEKLLHIRIAAARQYRPDKYSGRVMLFKRDQLLSGRYLDPEFGWGDRIEGGLEVSVLRTDHFDIFNEPCVDTVARRLLARLKEIQEENS